MPETGTTPGEAGEGGGVLTLAAVPIGRAEDASSRLRDELARATLIAAEDTRRVRWLASSLDIELKARIVSYYDAVEARRTADLLGELDSLDLDSDLDDAVIVVEWGEGLAERLAERHLDIRLERVSHSDVRIATWEWNRA